jgi:hypothetical protein
MVAVFTTGLYYWSLLLVFTTGTHAGGRRQIRMVIGLLLPLSRRFPFRLLCHIIIHTMSHHHTYYVTSSYILCHIIMHTMPHHHTYYVTSSYILCRIIIHTMSHHHTILIVATRPLLSVSPPGL